MNIFDTLAGTFGGGGTTRRRKKRTPRGSRSTYGRATVSRATSRLKSALSRAKRKIRTLTRRKRRY